MLIRKNLLIATATLTLLGTATVTPAQAFTLSFQSTDGKVTGNIVSSNSLLPPYYPPGLSSLSMTSQQGWSVSGLVWLPGTQLGNFMSTPYPIPGGQAHILSNFVDVSTYAELFKNKPPNLPLYYSIVEKTAVNPIISLICHSNSNCLGDYGQIKLDMSFTDTMYHSYNWVGYQGTIAVTAWNPTGTSIPITPLPTNSVPEPSSVFALLLLATGWLVKDLKTRFF
ncbi:PEP-CTERM sorting domain-containing protein [Phormidium sp. LEGE 05292]|uniref:PEP-CTERM sorting domain-containing protein n=1 Tax=[Phormidium] sp. LEGE 05292 TaxID=767427 RepID=UPI001881F048|nr:PEP-CTERM sorting domain-containing protein [Phormidium sp. LEGE 05292]MBE9228259.1 PEP-CTERM sorting domain-containing protein [Phormidium sp. LEGE 05292]